MNAILSFGTLFILTSQLPTALVQQEKTGIPWWFWALMVVTLILLVLMLFNRPKEEDREEKMEKSRETTTANATSKGSSPFEQDDDDVDFGPYSTDGMETEAPTAPPSPFIDTIDDEIPVQPGLDTSYMRPDDLTIIEGIGPKIAKILAQADIHTYTQLANSDADQLLVALASAGIFMTDPSTWPDQARFAAEGKWDELKKLQDSLKGGRQVN
jgi:predicted flap endonuclease-1-like 5' DNA nuclease